MALSSIALLRPHSAKSGQQTDQRERLIDTKGSYPDCPIKIVGLETGKRKISLGKPFPDDDDWIKGLRIRVKNFSDKSLTHVGIRIDFERPASQANLAGAVWDLWYGLNPFSIRPDEDIPPPLVRLIEPHETELIELSETEYEAMRVFLTEVSFPASIERIHVSIYTIGFTDGTAWAGQLYRRDRGSKHGWTPADKPKGSARKRAAFSSNITLVSYETRSAFASKSRWLVGGIMVGSPLAMPAQPDFLPCGSAYSGRNMSKPTSDLHI
jgi:hypothetical protein